MEKTRHMKGEKIKMSKQVSLLKRGIAFLVDLYLGSLLATLPISFVTYIKLGSMTQNVFLLDKHLAVIVMMLSLLLMIFYYVIIPLYLMKGQTLGKRLMDIQIVYDEQSNLVKRQFIFMFFMTSFGTMIGQLISVISGYNVMVIMNDITLSFSLLSVGLIIFAKDHKGLHDKLAKSYFCDIKYI